MNQTKSKLLKDVRKHPQEFKMVQEIMRDKQKIKDEYPFTFIDKENDCKKMKVFSKDKKIKLINDTRDISPLLQEKSKKYFHFKFYFREGSCGK